MAQPPKTQQAAAVHIRIFNTDTDLIRVKRDLCDGVYGGHDYLRAVIDTWAGKSYHLSYTLLLFQQQRFIYQRGCVGGREREEEGQTEAQGMG